MSNSPNPDRRYGFRAASGNEAGFTIVEMMIVSVLALIVVMAAYQLLVSQSRLLSSQGEMIDARDSIVASLVRVPPRRCV